jgi:hypothetical protein
LKSSRLSRALFFCAEGFGSPRDNRRRMSDA